MSKLFRAGGIEYFFSVTHAWSRNVDMVRHARLVNVIHTAPSALAFFWGTYQKHLNCKKDTMTMKLKEIAY
jgi:hypothetical protein